MSHYAIWQRFVSIDMPLRLPPKARSNGFDRHLPLVATRSRPAACQKLTSGIVACTTTRQLISSPTVAHGLVKTDGKFELCVCYLTVCYFAVSIWVIVCSLHACHARHLARCEIFQRCLRRSHHLALANVVADVVEVIDWSCDWSWFWLLLLLLMPSALLIRRNSVTVVAVE